MLNKIELEKLPKMFNSKCEMKLLRQIDFSGNINIPCAIQQDHIVQIAVSINYNSGGYSNFVFYLTKGISPIEALNIPTIRILSTIFEQSLFLLDKYGNVTGLKVSNIKEAVLSTYTELRNSKQIDKCIETLFPPFKENNSFLQGELCAFQLQNKSIKDNFNVIPLLTRNPFYLYLVSETLRNKKGTAVRMLGWTKSEIESNDYLNDLLMLFENVYFLGYSNNENEWSSFELVVSQPYSHINSLDDF